MAKMKKNKFRAVKDIGNSKSKNKTGPSLHKIKKDKKKENLAKETLMKTETAQNFIKRSKSQSRRLRKKMLMNVFKEKEVLKDSIKSKNKKEKSPTTSKKGKMKDNTNEAIKDIPQKSGFKGFMTGLPRNANFENCTEVLNKSGIFPKLLNIVKGNKKTYGIVIFETEENLNDAVSSSQNLKLEGKSIQLRKFKDKKEIASKKTEKRVKEDNDDEEVDGENNEEEIESKSNNSQDEEMESETDNGDQ